MTYLSLVRNLLGNFRELLAGYLRYLALEFSQGRGSSSDHSRCHRRERRGGLTLLPLGPFVRSSRSTRRSKWLRKRRRRNSPFDTDVWRGAVDKFHNRTGTRPGRNGLWGVDDGTRCYFRFNRFWGSNLDVLDLVFTLLVFFFVAIVDTDDFLRIVTSQLFSDFTSIFRR